MNTDYIGYAIAIVTFLVSIIVSYYFYVRSLRNKEPVYSIKNNVIILNYNSKYPNLKITYKTKKIENFSVSKVLFYNRGAETITKQDIDTINHLRITAKEGVKILDASILQTNNLSSRFMLEIENSNQVLLNFDYINTNQGLVIQVSHTGISDNDITVVGDMVGVNNIVNLIPQSNAKKVIFSALRKNNFSKQDAIFMFRVSQFFCLILGMFSLSAIIYPSMFSQFRVSSSGKSLIDLIFEVIILLFAFGQFFSFSTLIKDFQENRVSPEGLELFYD